MRTGPWIRRVAMLFTALALAPGALAQDFPARQMESQAGQIIGGSPAELDAVVARETRQFTQVVREQGLKPE